MSYHPEKQMLQAYVEGSLDDVAAFTVAIHLESCPECKRRVAILEQACGDRLADAPALESSGEDLSAMLEAIVSMEQNSEPFRVPPQPQQIMVNGKAFLLPRALSRHMGKIGQWRSYGGKVFSASIDIAQECRVNLMYIAENVQIPQHIHKGTESTLILHGGFSDEDGHYEAGDFLVKDASVKHSPSTSVGEDCLCLTALTEPMVFTQGVARLFNRFGKGMYP
ncbi:ChrR family anti-sigma-E factor [Vibrio atypicus]|uniref:ChrR family anti-sigma-E factor n=1 Tax=Vibrio atypicus TaxID=558271 RepID=UPI003735F0EE